MKQLLHRSHVFLRSFTSHIAVYWGIVLVYLSPYFLGAKRVRISIHDNLDGMFPSFKFLSGLDVWFASNDTMVSGFLHELPRVALGSEFNVILWLFAAFPTYPAYAINMILIHCCAFGGAYLLLKHYLLPQQSIQVQGLLALFFALLPFWPSGGWSIAGQPLIVFCLLNLIHQQQIRWSILGLIVYPFYSHFFWSGIFFYGLLVLLIAWCVYQNRKIPLLALAGLGGMGLLHLLVEYRLFHAMFWGDFHFHREAFQLSVLASWGEIAGFFFKHIREGYYQSLSLHFGPILLICLLSLIPKQRRLSNNQWHTLGLITLLLGCSTLYAAYNSFLFSPLKESISLVNAFDLGRAYTLYPILWLLIGGLAFRTILKQDTWIKTVAILALVIQMGYGFQSSHEFRWTYLEPIKNAAKATLGKGIPTELPPTFNGFYCVDNFTQAKALLGQDVETYHTASVGFHPGVTRMNGLATIDGYTNVYPLSYKQQFREIIAPELHKSQEIQHYFDSWGNRCYVFSAELGRNLNDLDADHIDQLDLSVAAMKKLNTRYLFSAVSIDRLPSGMHFFEKIEEANQHHPLYIYIID